MTEAVKSKIFRLCLGNIIIAVTVLALLFVTVPGGSQKVDARSEVIYSGKSEAAVSLMINVYWGTEYIRPMLDIFSRYEMKTTFFVGGSWVAGNAQTLAEIYAAGHEIGNHGYYHKDHKKLDEAYNIKEISAAHEAVKAAIDFDMNLFAPPSGAFGESTLSAAEKLGYRTIMWTRDTIDWRDHDADLIYRRAVKNIKGGDLILMHPTECTAKVLERIVLTIRAKGLTVAPVSEVIAETQQ